MTIIRTVVTFQRANVDWNIVVKDSELCELTCPPSNKGQEGSAICQGNEPSDKVCYCTEDHKEEELRRMVHISS